MSLNIPAHDHGLVRVFRVSPALQERLATTDDLGALEQALGVIIAKPQDVQLVAADTLSDVSLAQFLTMAYGVDAAALTDLQDILADTFVIIRSGAFGGVAVTLKDSSDAQLISTVAEDGPTAPALTPLTAETAKGTAPTGKPPKKPKSDARIGGMVATVALLLMGILVWLMIWIGG